MDTTITLGLLKGMNCTDEVLNNMIGEGSSRFGFKRFYYADCYLLVSALKNNIVDYIVFNIANPDEALIMVGLVKDYKLVFCSSFCEDTTILHLYKKYNIDETVPKKKSLHTNNAVSLLFSKSLGYILVFSLEYLLIIHAFYGIISLITSDTGIPIYWNIMLCIVSFYSSLISVEALQNLITYYPFLGYWKYYDLPETDGDKSFSSRIDHRLPRIVQIERKNGKLHLKGWQAGRTHMMHFESITCEIMSRGLGETTQQSGNIFYTYQGCGFKRGSKEIISGMSFLEWKREGFGSIVHDMMGWYAGRDSKRIGTIVYQRTTENEFKSLLSSYHSNDAISSIYNDNTPSHPD